MLFDVLSGTRYVVEANSPEEALDKFYAIYGGEGCPDHNNECDCLEEVEADTIVDYTKRDCPNHKGSFDCTPFCEMCGGAQVIV